MVIVLGNLSMQASYIWNFIQRTKQFFSDQKSVKGRVDVVRF